MEEISSWIPASVSINKSSTIFKDNNFYIFRVDRAQKDADEFMIESKQLENEYETTIDQNERKIKDLSIANNRAQNEIDALRVQ